MTATLIERRPIPLPETMPDPIVRAYRPGITVVIPTIAPRSENGYLERAVRSVNNQKEPGVPVYTILAFDSLREGAMATRNRGLYEVETEWTAFLDDDDEFKPNHLRSCLRWAQREKADMVYPWFEQPEQNWDGLGGFGIPFEIMAHELADRNWIPVTVLVKTKLMQDVGGFQYPWPGATDCEDWGAWRALVAAGAKISHLPSRTWIWHHHGKNTSGKGDRW